MQTASLIDPYQTVRTQGAGVTKQTNRLPTDLTSKFLSILDHDATIKIINPTLLQDAYSIPSISYDTLNRLFSFFQCMRINRGPLPGLDTLLDTLKTAVKQRSTTDTVPFERSLLTTINSTFSNAIALDCDRTLNRLVFDVYSLEHWDPLRHMAQEGYAPSRASIKEFKTEPSRSAVYDDVFGSSGVDFALESTDNRTLTLNSFANLIVPNILHFRGMQETQRGALRELHLAKTPWATPAYPNSFDLTNYPCLQRIFRDSIYAYQTYRTNADDRQKLMYLWHRSMNEASWNTGDLSWGFEAGATDPAKKTTDAKWAIAEYLTNIYLTLYPRIYNDGTLH